MTEELEEYPREPLDTDQIFAKFGRKTLSDYEVCSLSMASLVCNPDVPFDGIYLTYVAQCDGYVQDIKEFCLGVASQLASGKYRGKNGKRHRAYVEGYSESWGRHAVADAMTIAFLGADKCPGKNERAALLGVGQQAYQRIRDFIAGMLHICIQEYRLALEWAMGKRRDTELQARWGRVTGLKWTGKLPHDIMVREDNLLSPGCLVTPSCGDSEEYRSIPKVERLNIGFSDDELWRP